MVQLSHAYMTTGKTIALTRRIFVSKVMSLLFNNKKLFEKIFKRSLLSACFYALNKSAFFFLVGIVSNTKISKPQFLPPLRDS